MKKLVTDTDQSAAEALRAAESSKTVSIISPHNTKKDNAYGSLKNSYDLVLCNLQEITTPEQLEELKHKAHSKCKNCETAEQIMYEWAMSIPEVYEAEAKRINKRKKDFK